MDTVKLNAMSFKDIEVANEGFNAPHEKEFLLSFARVLPIASMWLKKKISSDSRWYPNYR